MIRKELDFSVEKVADRSRTFRFIGSDEKPDRVGDIVEVEGWELENWQKNPVILWGHNSSMPPVGRGINVAKSKKPKRLTFDVEFTSEDVYPFGATIGRMVEAGFLKAVSVGFIPKESEPVDKDDDDNWFAPRRFKKQELLELSIVTVPANAGALLISNAFDRRSMREKGLAGYEIKTVYFNPKKFTEETAKAWLEARGHVHQGIQVDEKGYLTVDVGSDLDFEDTEDILIESGVKATVGACKAKPAITIPHNPVDNPISDETLKEIFQRNNETLQGLVKALGSLNDTVRDLSKLAEILDTDKSAPSTSDHKSVEAVTEEYDREVEKALEELKAKVNSLPTTPE